MRAELPRYLRRLDAFVTVTADDAADYGRHTKLPSTRLLHIPNSVPEPRVAPSTGDSKIIVAAGRMIESKRFDLLITAFAKVVAEAPDWQLRLYGDGRVLESLRTLVGELGLHNNVLLMGSYTPLESEWAKGSIAAAASEREAFGMTLIEAMRCGVPVVSTAAPPGPREIVNDGVDGLLTAVGDVDAMADALLRLIGDPQQRRRMAEAALAGSRAYDLAPVGERYEKLFLELAAAKRRPRFAWLRRRPAPVEPPPVFGPSISPTQVSAACVVAADGTVELTPTGAGEGFVWRRAGAGQSAVVPQDGPVVRPGALTEGSWQLELADGTTVLSGPRDTRALVDFVAPAAGGVTLQVPYRTAAGGLGLRVWARHRYAEIAAVHVDEALHLTGRLVGARFGAGEPVLELSGPAAAAPLPVRVLSPTTWEVTVPVLKAGTWLLWLNPDGTERIRVGRILDDVLDKHRAYVLPRVTAGDPVLQPFYTAANELSVRVTG